MSLWQSISLRNVNIGDTKVSIFFTGVLVFAALATVTFLWDGQWGGPEQNENVARQSPVERAPRTASPPTTRSSVAEAGQNVGPPQNDIPDTSQRAAATPRIPALPGIQGFYVSPDDGSPVNTLATALASESEDDAWSVTMEGRLLDEISRLRNVEVVSVNVECRSATCGALLVFPRGTEDSSRIVNFPRIADALGFHLRAGLPTIADDGTPFTAFYMQMPPEAD